MDRHIKERWIEALRSGQYKQGTGLMRNSQNEFCALGVLCDVYVRDGLGSWEKPTPDATHPDSWQMHAPYSVESEMFPPTAVARWAGFEDRMPFLHTDDGPEPVYVLNDNGVSFELLADLIEADSSL